MAAPAPPARPPAARARIHQWVVEHDEKLLFTLLYVGLAVVLSIWISLFWLVVVVAVHLGFELIRQARLRASRRMVVLESLWELKLDAALVLLALVVGIYMEMILGVAGLQGAARLTSASRVAARFSGWQRTIRGVLLSVDDAAQLARFASRKGGAAADDFSTEEAPPGEGRWGSWSGRWKLGARISIGIGIACALLILAAPVLTGRGLDGVLEVLRMELQPFP